MLVMAVAARGVPRGLPTVAPDAVVANGWWENVVVRRTPLSLVAAFVLLAGGVVTTRSATSAGAVTTCSSSSVRVSEYNSWVGAGNVNLLFWIRNVQAQSCTVRGYVRVAYVGVYGLKSGPLHHVHTLSVRVEDAMNGGDNGNDFGGVRSGPISVVTLAPHGVDSFWIYGTDEPAGAPPVRCITSYRMRVWLAGASQADL